jgi:hypothetical protein
MGYSFSQRPAFNPFSFSVRTNLLNRHFMVDTFLPSMLLEGHGRSGFATR